VALQKAYGKLVHAAFGGMRIITGDSEVAPELEGMIEIIPRRDCGTNLGTVVNYPKGI
jgi:hypothetical protein